MGQTNSNPDAVAEYFRTAAKKLISIVMPSSSSKALKVDDPFHYIVKICDAGKSPSNVAKARFIYCWEWIDNGKKWVNKGLFMTDQDGILFNMPDYINRCKEVSGFNLKDLQYALKPLDGFSISKLFSNPKEAIAISSYFKAVSTEPSHVIFLRSSEYLFTFCPPEIVDPNTQPGIVPKRSDGNGTHDKRLKQAEKTLYTTTSTVESDHTSTNTPVQQNVEQLIDDRLMFWETPCSHWFSSVENIKKFGYFIARTWWPPRKSEPESILTREQWNLHYKPGKKFNTLRLNLPVTLEEEVSRLAWDTHFLDIQYGKFIQQTESYLKACSFLNELAFWTDLSYKCPGFLYEKELRKLPGSSYQGESSRAGQTFEVAVKKRVNVEDRSSIKNLTDTIQSFKANLENHATSNQNPAFVNAHKIIYDAKIALKSHLKEKGLIDRINEWYEFLGSYSTANNYPYSIKVNPLYIQDLNLLKQLSPELEKNSSKQTMDAALKKHVQDQLAIYQVAYEAFATLFGCRAGAESGIPNPQTLEAEYIGAVLDEFAEFDNILINACKENEKKVKGKKTLTQYFFELLEQECKSAGVMKFRALSSEELRESTATIPIEKKSFLGALFGTEGNAISGLWNTQQGPDSAVTSIWKLSLGAQSAITLASKTNIGFESRFLTDLFRKQIGLIFRNGTSGLDWNSLKVACRVSIKSALQVNTGGKSITLVQLTKDIIKKAGNEAAPTAPTLISTLTSGIGAIVAIKGFIDAYQEGVNKSFQFTPQDLTELAKQVHGIGICLSGININTFSYNYDLGKFFAGLTNSANKAISAVNTTLLNAGRVLSLYTGFVNLYQAYKIAGQVVYFQSTGETLYRDLHFISAAFTAFAGVAGVVSTVQIVSALAAGATLEVAFAAGAAFSFAAGVFIVVPLVIGGVYLYLKSIEPGMKKLFNHYIEKINAIPLFSGQGEKHYFQIPVSITTKRTAIDWLEDLLDSEKKDVEIMYCHTCKIHDKSGWDAIKSMINSTIKPYHNLCLIHAGATLRLMGYGDETIIISTKEDDERIRGQEDAMINDCILTEFKKNPLTFQSNIINSCSQQEGDVYHQKYTQEQFN
ncbi:MAG TPA: hypothetical protein VHO70_06440 [Chitinispirillaceae bacterium]|nr:hypothetical protein [Chitinispirillaceae bacterium]